MQEPALRTTVNTLKRVGVPSSEENKAQLEKILASQVFQGAETLKSFLGFVVGKSLGGLESEVKEYLIATEVFGRSDNYDPRIDSLVRVQAARLRSKLEEYYASEGKNDKVYIDLPKGHYVPVFAYFQPGSQRLPKGLPQLHLLGKRRFLPYHVAYCLLDCLWLRSSLGSWLITTTQRQGSSGSTQSHRGSIPPSSKRFRPFGVTS
jgi:hypothetical protein